MAKTHQQGHDIPKSNPEDLSISDGTLFCPNNSVEPISIQKYGMDYNNHLPKSMQSNKNQNIQPGPSIGRPRNEEPPCGGINFFCCRGNFLLEKRRNSWSVTGQTAHAKIQPFLMVKIFQSGIRFVVNMWASLELKF